VKSWLKSLKQAGDLQGAVAPNVLGSAGPLAEEQFAERPQRARKEDGGTFPGTLALTVSVLDASAADLKTAAIAALNASAGKLAQPEMVATELPISFSSVQTATSKDGPVWPSHSRPALR